MKPKSLRPILVIDFHLRFRGELYKIDVKRLLKWLLPLVVLGGSYVSHSS